MRRGDIVIGAMRGDFTGKPRPYVVVQSDRTLGRTATVTVCPLTGSPIGIGRVRIAVGANDGTGLETTSEIEVDRVTTIRVAGVRGTIGRVPADVMLQVDDSLRRWLDL